MPIYEYRCGSCGHQLEAIQKVSEPRLVECPECELPALTKLVSPAGFRLKGGGWYETDFKKGNKRNLASMGGEKSDSTGAKSDNASASAEKKTETSTPKTVDSKSKAACT